jgi:hypothetical protein
MEERFSHFKITAFWDVGPNNLINRNSTLNYKATLLAIITIVIIILWHVDPLQGNDSEIGNYTIAVTR